MYKRLHGKRWERWAGIWALPGVVVLGLWIYGAVFSPVIVERTQNLSSQDYRSLQIALWSSRIECSAQTIPTSTFWSGNVPPKNSTVAAWEFRHMGGKVIGELSSLFNGSLGLPGSLDTPVWLVNVGLYFGHWKKSDAWFIGVPLPLLLLIFAGPWLFIHWKKRSRRHALASACPTCGYDVRGLERGCPECGWSRHPDVKTS